MLDSFCKALEEDAKERAERRKEREKTGRELKKSGNTAFKQGDFEAALVSYSEGIKQMPWDITLYTNRGQVIATWSVDVMYSSLVYRHITRSLVSS